MSENQHTKPKFVIFEEITNIAKQKEGSCLSQLSDYKNGRSKLKFKCKEPLHEVWETTGFSIRIMGNWCPRCGRVISETKHKNAPVRLEEMKQTAIARQGICLSDIYVKAKNKLKFKCHNASHKIFEMTYQVVSAGQWCPECSSGRGERLVRTCFEQLFGKPFSKVKPEWLINDEGNRLELDGYNEELSLAFEHNGLQHVNARPYFSSADKLVKIQKHDRIKNLLSSMNKIKLITIPEVPTQLSLNKLKKFVLESCKANGIDVLFPDKDIDYNIAYYGDFEDSLADLVNLAKERDGELLSKVFLGVKIPLKWKCLKCDTIWMATPHMIKQRTWCPTCGKTKRKRKLIPILVDEIIKRYLIGESAAKLAIDYKVHWISILRILKNNNIKIRPSHTYQNSRGKDGQFVGGKK